MGYPAGTKLLIRETANIVTVDGKLRGSLSSDAAVTLLEAEETDAEGRITRDFRATLAAPASVSGTVSLMAGRNIVVEKSATYAVVEDESGTSWIPWLVGGAVAAGALYLLFRK
jgi:hypothetical protein